MSPKMDEQKINELSQQIEKKLYYLVGQVQM